MFSTAPPGTAARGPEQTAQECSARNFESPLWQDTALRSIPDFMRGQRRENGLVVRGPMASRVLNSATYRAYNGSVRAFWYRSKKCLH